MNNNLVEPNYRLLLQRNVINGIFNLNNEVINYTSTPFVHNILICDRFYNLKNPKYLEIKLAGHVNINDFKSICHNITFDMYIGSCKYLSIPLRFMMNLKDYEIEDDNIYITIPFNLFFDNINLTNLPYHEVSFKLTFVNNNFESCNLITENTLIDNLNTSQSQQIVQQLNSIEIESSDGPLNEFNCNIKFDNLHKGFYIECENVDDINELGLNLDGIQQILYNRYLVRRNCVKINQHLLYLPFNLNKSQYDRTNNAMIGSINLSACESCILNIKFNTPNTKLTVYGLSLNMFRTSQGIGGMILTANNEHSYITYNDNNEQIMQLRIPRQINQQRLPENIVNKLVDVEKSMCCISHDTIEPNARYMNCSTCKNNFLENSLKQWFQQRPRHKTCPMCRTGWNNFNIYINIDN